MARRRADQAPRSDRRRPGAARGADRARSAATATPQRHAPPSSRPTSWRPSPTPAARPHHRARGIGQDARAHRARPPPARRVAAAAACGVPGRLQHACPGRDAGAHHGSARPQRAHPELDRAGDRQRRRAVRAAGASLAHDRRARGARAARALRQIPAEAQHRSAGAVDRRPRARCASGCWRPREVEAGTAATSTASARSGRSYRGELERARRGRLRRADPARDRRAARRNPRRARAAQRACRLLLVDEFQDLTPAHMLLVRLLGGGGRTCSAWATTTRPSTATTAPTRLADRLRRLVPRRRRPSARGQLPLPAGRGRGGRPAAAPQPRGGSPRSIRAAARAVGRSRLVGRRPCGCRSRRPSPRWRRRSPRCACRATSRC